MLRSRKFEAIKKETIRRRVMLFILIYLVFITAYLSVNTMSKYVGTTEGAGTVEVAKWEDIKACNQELIDLEGCECVGGLDYAKTDDFVGVCLLFKKSEQFYVIHHSFVCNKSRDSSLLPGNFVLKLILFFFF